MGKPIAEYSKAIRQAILEIYKPGDSSYEVARVLNDRFPKLSSETVRRVTKEAGVFKSNRPHDNQTTFGSQDNEQGPAYRLGKPTLNELRIKELEEQNAQLRKDLFKAQNCVVVDSSIGSPKPKFSITFRCSAALEDIKSNAPFIMEYDSETGIKTIKEK